MVRKRPVAVVDKSGDSVLITLIVTLKHDHINMFGTEQWQHMPGVDLK